MIGIKIKECRKLHKLTQEQLAEALGIEKRTLGSYEQETRNVPNDLLLAMADYFNVSTDYLLGRDSKTSDVPQPDAIAAHTDQNLTPELRAEIDRYVKQALHKYMPKDDSDKR